jgi:hypothetical protein
MSNAPARPCHVRLWIMAALVVALGAADARADDASLPTDAITAKDATAYHMAIGNYVVAKVSKLQSDDPAVQEAAKDDIIKEVSPPVYQPTASFFNEYCDALNQALLPLAKDKRLQVRLNAAMVNAVVADKASANKTGNARQVDSTLAFIQDAQEPIVLWGLKAATDEIPALVQLPAGVGNDKLTPAILPAVKAHPNSGPIIEEAYKALTLDTMGNLGVLQPPQLQNATGPVLDLFSYRVSLYSASAPADPLADTAAVVFLIRSRVWSAELVQQQRQAMDTMYKLCDSASRLALGNANSNDLFHLTNETGRAFIILGMILDDHNLTAAGDAVGKLNKNTPPAQVKAAMQKLQAAITDAKHGADNGASDGLRY